MDVVSNSADFFFQLFQQQSAFDDYTFSKLIIKLLLDSLRCLVWIILFGASPMKTGTYQLAVYLAFLLNLSILLAHISGKFYKRLAKLQNNASWQVVLFGCWAGAVVIPLDWDRPFQVWPWPCVYGSTFGFVVVVLYEILGLARWIPIPPILSSNDTVTKEKKSKVDSVLSSETPRRSPRRLMVKR